FALAPGPSECAIDVNVDAEIGPLRANLVGRDHVIHQRLNECCLVKIEEFISRRLWSGGGRRGRWLLCLSSRCRSHCGRTAGRCGAAYDGAFQKIATIELLFLHGLPLPAREDAHTRAPRARS